MPIHQVLIAEYRDLDFSDYTIGVAHVFAPNTLPMLVALHQTGAQIELILENGNIYDQDTVDLMRAAGFAVGATPKQQFDLVIDCGGYFSDRPPKIGSVEVTRSGIHKYAERNIHYCLVDVDNTTSKLIETFLGNPEAVERTFSLYFDDTENFLQGKSFAVVGFGKIGRGLAHRFRTYGRLTVVDVNTPTIQKAASLGFDTYKPSKSKDRNSKALQHIDIVFTSTGLPGVMSSYFNPRMLESCLKINVGAVDEWGDEFSEEQVFHSKNKPFNFNLTPPTNSRYIDPILAAQLEGIRFIAENHEHLDKGHLPFPKRMDQKIVKRYENIWNDDLEVLEQYFDL